MMGLSAVSFQPSAKSPKPSPMNELDPNRTFTFPIPGDEPPHDADRPPNGQRAVVCRFGTCRQWDQYEDAIEQTNTVEGGDREWVAAMAAVLDTMVIEKRGFTDWAELSRADIILLARDLPGAATVAELDKKKSARRSRIDRAASPLMNSAPAAASSSPSPA